MTILNTDAVLKREIQHLDHFELRIFKACDNPEAARKFNQVHESVLSGFDIKGMVTTRDTWIENPMVTLMVIYDGENPIAGSRLHTYHPEYIYPFMEVMRIKALEQMDVLNDAHDFLHGEWSGLWCNPKYRGRGFGDLLCRVGVGTAHSIGLDLIYGICPRHTLDAFRTVGFQFQTRNDEILSFPYPSSRFTSHIIKCHVNDMRYTFIKEKEAILKILDNPESLMQIGSGDKRSVISIPSFPEGDDTLRYSKSTDLSYEIANRSE